MIAFHQLACLHVTETREKKTLILSYISWMCWHVVFQVARGRLKGNFIVHNFASTSDFSSDVRLRFGCFQGRDQQWKIWWSRQYWFLFRPLLLPSGSPSTWWNIFKNYRFFTNLLNMLELNLLFNQFPLKTFSSRLTRRCCFWLLAILRCWSTEAGLFYGIDTDCCYGRNMQKLWCVQHKNIKGLQEGLHMRYY